MKTKQIFYYTFLQYRKNKRKQLLTFFLCTCIMAVIAMISLMQCLTKIPAKQVEGLLAKDLNNYYFLYYCIDDDAEHFSVQNELKELGYNTVVSISKTDGVYLFAEENEITNQQNEMKSKIIYNDFWGDSYFEGLDFGWEMPLQQEVLANTTNNNFFDITKIELSEGEFSTPQNENEIYIYLGANFKNIPLDSEYKGFFGERVIVKGYLKKGSRTFDVEYLNRRQLEDMSLNYNLDESIVHIDNRNYSCNWIIDITGMDVKKVERDLEGVLSKHEGSYAFYPVTKNIEERYAKYDSYFILLKKLLVMFFIISFCSIFGNQLSEMINDKNRYRIWYASGFSKVDIMKIRCLENMFQFFCGAVLVLSISLFYVGRYYKFFLRPYNKNMLYDMGATFGITCAVVLGSAFVLGFISVLIPCLNIRDKNPVDFK